MALVLICLGLAMLTSAPFFLPLGIGFLLVAMTFPGLFKPFARVWFGCAHVLGSLTSRLVLTLIFFGMVTPVGLIRRLLGKDAMQVKRWKQGTASVFRTRDHLFKPDDLDHPY